VRVSSVQGDLEARLGIAPAPMMQRGMAERVVAANHVGFIEAICLPLYMHWDDFVAGGGSGTGGGRGSGGGGGGSSRVSATPSALTLAEAARANVREWRARADGLVPFGAPPKKKTTPVHPHRSRKFTE
jgi:3'5'-cyclic nucleotide phosphodiesterase